MSLSELDVKRLLAAAMAYDNRKPGEANIAAWVEAAERGRWTFNEALEAVKAHYDESAEFLMPAHINARLRKDRRFPAPFAELEAAESTPAAVETRERIMSIVGESFALPRSIRPARRVWAHTSPEHAARREAARAELARISAQFVTAATDAPRSPS